MDKILRSKCLVTRYEDGKVVSETLEDVVIGKTHELTLRFSDADYQKLEKLADANNQFVKYFVKDRVLDLIGVKYGKMVKKLTPRTPPTVKT